MSANPASDRFTALPDDTTFAATIVVLEEHGFSVDLVDDFDATRRAVLARIPEGSSVMANPSVTLPERPGSRMRSTTVGRMTRRVPRRWRSTTQPCPVGPTR